MTSTTVQSDSPPLSRQDLVRFFESAERSTDTPERIGTEQELFGVAFSENGAVPINYDAHIAPMLRGMVEKFGWELGEDRGDQGQIVALVRDRAGITLEPGGQVELSGAPLATLQETCAESTRHHRELQTVAEPLGVAFLATGFHPFAHRDEIHWMPKARYQVMRDYLPTRGHRALDMMLRTCTIQANMDYSSEHQCGERFRLALAISAPVTAMFANSPFIEGRRSKFLSQRSDTWTEVDPDRCGIPKFAFEGTFSYTKYIDWALNVPMFFIKRAGRYLPCHMRFIEYLAKGFDAPDGTHQSANYADWELHLSTLFPEVRIKPFVEVRSADTVSPAMVCAMPALWKGILYDHDATAAAWSRVESLDHPDRLDLWRESRTLGFRSDRVWGLSKALLDIARDGLARIHARGESSHDEAHFLDPLQNLVDARTTLADQALTAIGGVVGRDRAGRLALVEHFRVAGARP